MVPAPRMVAWAAVGLAPAAGVAWMLADSPWPALALFAFFAVLAATDALVSARRLAGVEVTLPEAVRLFQGREGELAADIAFPGSAPRFLRLGLDVAWPLVTPQADRRVALPESGRPARVAWKLSGARQGSWPVGGIFLEAPSFLGFWEIRAARRPACEARVYPNILAEKERMAGLFLGRGAGVHAFRMVGRGREFEKLRDYQAGDGMEDIHWKATAKRRRPVTKVFQVERTQRVIAVVDASRLSARPAARFSGKEEGAGQDDPMAPVLLERFSAAALLLGMAAIRQGDLFGVGAFSDRMRVLVGAKGGTAHLNACREALYRVTPEPVSPDYYESFSQLAARVSKRSLLVFFTCLDDAALAESFVANVGLAARRHLVLAAVLVPARARPLFSGPPRGLYPDLAGHLLHKELKKAQRELSVRGAGLLLLSDENLCPAVVQRYVSIKRRQML